MNRRVMTMADWIKKLDDFLRISDREVLDHAGQVSRQDCRTKADSEYDKWRAIEANKTTPVEEAFNRVLNKSKNLERDKNKRSS